MAAVVHRGMIAMDSVQTSVPAGPASRSTCCTSVFGHAAFRGQQEAWCATSTAGGDAVVLFPDRRRQVDLLPGAGALPRRRRHRRLAADRADARPGRGAAPGRRRRRGAQFLAVAARRRAAVRAQLTRRRARAALRHARAARRRPASSPCCRTCRSRSSPSTRRIASASGAMTSAPNTASSPRIAANYPRRAAHRADGHRRSARPAPTSSSGSALDAARGLHHQLRPARTSATRSSSATSRASSCCASCARHKGESGIVYCLSRKKVEDIAEWLNKEGIRALPYHAGMDRARARAPTRTPSSRRRASASSPPSPSAWASTSRTCAMSPISTCRPRSRPTTRRPAAPAATACRPRPGCATAWPTSCSAAA